MKYDVRVSFFKTIEAENYKDAVIKAEEIKSKIDGDDCFSEVRINHVMDDANGQETKLVDLINESYNYEPNRFKTILNMLGKRDKDKCEKEGISLPLKKDYDVYSYLMNVADKEDLKTIITFCRATDLRGKKIFCNI